MDTVDRRFRHRRFVSTLALGVACLLLAAAADGQEGERAAVQLEHAIQVEVVQGDLQQAMRLYREIIDHRGTDRAVAAEALLRLGTCQEKLGDPQAQEAYEQVARDYADVAEVAAEARLRLSAWREESAPTATEEAGDGLVVRRVLEGPMADGLGAPSPDGRLLSVIDWNTGDLAVYDMLAETTRKLTDTWWPQFPLLSIFSPDGRQIAYTWFNEQVSAELRVIGVGGGEARVLVDDEEIPYVGPDAWAPDGSWILGLISRRDKTAQIARIAVDDGSIAVLKSLDWRSPQNMSLSPDGRWIAYDFPSREDTVEGRDVYLLAADGGGEVAIVEHPASDTGPLWTPDGDWLLFASDRGGSFDLWAQRVSDDGIAVGAPRVVKAGIGSYVPMGFTADGSLFYGSGASFRELHLAELDPATGQLAASPRRAIDGRTGAQTSPVFSPDGRRLVYVYDPAVSPANNSLDWLLVVHDLETGEEREVQIPAQLSGFTPTDWAPDGRRILARAYDRRRLGTGIYWFDVETGDVEAIQHFTDANIRAPILTPDGSRIVFLLLQRASGSKVVVHDLRTGEEKVIADLPFGGLGPVSPDGRYLLARRRTDPERPDQQPNELVRIGLDSGTIDVLHTRPAGEDIGVLQWAPDQRGILFTLRPAVAYRNPDVQIELLRLPLDGGEPLPTGLSAAGELAGVHFHPDGRTFAFVSGQDINEVWRLDNLLEVLSRGSR